jgi:hypothetical protein
MLKTEQRKSGIRVDPNVRLLEQDCKDVIKFEADIAFRMLSSFLIFELY